MDGLFYCLIWILSRKYQKYNEDWGVCHGRGSSSKYPVDRDTRTWDVGYWLKNKENAFVCLKRLTVTVLLTKGPSNNYHPPTLSQKLNLSFDFPYTNTIYWSIPHGESNLLPIVLKILKMGQRVLWLNLYQEKTFPKDKRKKIRKTTELTILIVTTFTHQVTCNSHLVLLKKKRKTSFLEILHIHDGCDEEVLIIE